MRGASRGLSTEDTENGGQVSTQPDKFVPSTPGITRINGRRISFHDLASFAFPEKTDHHLSFLTGYDVRTCRRWRAGHNEPPAEALGVVLQEIMRRFHMR